MQPSTVVILLAFISICWAQATLFKHGRGGRCLSRDDDNNSGVKGFQFGDFKMFGTSYSQYVVHSNGYVTLTNSGSTGVYNSKDIVSLSSLTNGPMIAAFWGDVDNRPSGGEVFYKETTGASDLTMASMIIGNAFTSTSLMFAGWEKVGYFNRHREVTNTFQVVLATGTGPSGDSESYIIFVYTSIGWTSTDSATNDGTLPAQVGYTAGDGTNTHYLPRFSDALNTNTARLRSRLRVLPLNSNIDMSGVYVCRSDMPGTSCTPAGSFPPVRGRPRVEMQGPYPIDGFVTRSQARANALAHLSSHPEKTQLYEEDVEAMEMELDSISNSPSEQVNEPQVQINNFYTEYNDDKNTFEVK